MAAGALWGLVFVVPRMTPGLSSVDLIAGRFISYGGMAALAMLFTWRTHTWPTLIIGTVPIWIMLLGKPAGIKWSGLLPGLMLIVGGLALMMKTSFAQVAQTPAGGVHFWFGVDTGAGALLLGLVAGSTSTEILALDDKALIATVCIVTGIGSAWAASILWNVASQRLSVSLCGQLIVSETLFALLFSFLWDGAWPAVVQWLAAMLFMFGILASIRAHR